MASRNYKPKIVTVTARPENTTKQCGPCGKLGVERQSKKIVRVGFTYMRGEDECIDVCDEHHVELRRLINLPGQFPPHFMGDVWRE